ncbi:MAG: NAD(+) synthase, partial [Lachnospiraceae bacterium]|nr:NAD(+) synthase [Lachnospiraceae bacterium]
MAFDAKVELNRIIEWIRNWFEKNGPTAKAVIGISGGKDSTIVAALCVEALGKDRVVGVLMPNGDQKDIDDALKVVEHLGIEYHIINIKDTCNAIHKEL